MLKRLYIHNFRCLENFELPIEGRRSVLLVGKNGSGKTTVGFALQILQKIARGTNRVAELVKLTDFGRGRDDVPMRFEVEVELEEKAYKYSVAFEFPKGFKELRVFQESLSVDSEAIYSREGAQVLLAKTRGSKEAKFGIDWHLVALPIVQEQSVKDPLSIFKKWLARVLILRPIPSLICGTSEDETLTPNVRVTDFGAWFTAVTVHYPKAYAKIDEYLKQVIPDLDEIQNPLLGTSSRKLLVQFSNSQSTFTIGFESLSDGEKCFMICALVLAANSTYGPVLCFWDEPDNYLALSEVGHFVSALRQGFQHNGQFVATSHNSEAIPRFSVENTLVLHRKSHFEPTLVDLASKLKTDGDLVGMLIRGDLEP